MITLHESNITSFPHDNGIGVLKDVIRAYAEEELNGLFEFYMEYDSEGHLVDELKEERIIKAKAQDKLGYQLFRIYSITKNHESDNLIIRAQHITYDLADNFVESLVANNLTKKQVMELIGSSTVLPHPFNVTSTNTTTRSSTRLYRTNPLQMIGGIEGSVLQIWGGQIERDNFNLILHDRRGSDDGVKVTYEKNITGLEATFDISGLVTRIFPFVYIEETDNEPARLITVSGKYIDSPHINDYEKIYIKPIDYSNDERIDIQDKTDAQIRQQLTNIASKYFEETGNDKIKVDMEVQFEHLWETEEYKDLAVLELVGMGDTVTIEHSRLKVDATAIVNYIRYDCIAGKNEEVRLGSVKARLTDNVNKTLDVVEKVEQAQQTANQAIRAANGKNTIYYGPDEPSSGIEGDLWFRVVDGEYTRTYRHDGIQWQLVLSVDVRDAMDEAQQAKDDAQSAVDRANQATQQATNAINQAQTAFDEAQQALGVANNAMTQATSAFSKAQEGFDLAQDAIDELANLEIGGRNLLVEGEMEWGYLSSSTGELVPTAVDGHDRTTGYIDVSNISTITLSQYDKIDDFAGQGRVLGYDKDKNFISVIYSNIDAASGWDKPKSITLDVSDVYYIRATLIWWGRNRYKLEKGNKATDWTPAPEDVDQKIDVVANDLDGLSVIVSNNVGEITSIQATTQGLRTDVSNLQGDVTTVTQIATGLQSRMSDAEGNITALQVTSTSLAGRLTDAEGNITTLQQTSSSLAGRLTDAEGNITTLTATVNGLQTTVSNIEGEVSSVTQLANALQVRMTDAEGNISTLTQTASSLQSTITEVRDNVGRWTKIYRVSATNPLNLTESDGSLLDDSYTYEVTAKVRRTSIETTAVAIFKANSSGGSGGAGWTLEIIYEQGRTFNHPEFFIDENGRPSIRLYNHTSYYDVEVIHEKTIGRESVSTRTQSQITQLSDAINLRVQKGDVINQINISTESILIDGRKVHITGQTTIDNGVIKSAHIQSLDAGKITTGTLDAGKISVINLSANSIRGGTLTSLNSITRFNLNTGVLNIGSQLELSSRGLETYSGGDRASLLDGVGHHFYRQGTYIGKIGTNNWTGDKSYRGLVFDLENEADYMTWAFRRDPYATIYTTMLAWHKTSTKEEKGFTFYDDVRIPSNYALKISRFRTDFSTSRIVSFLNENWEGVAGVSIRQDPNRDGGEGGIFIGTSRVALTVPQTQGSSTHTAIEVTRNNIRSVAIYNQTTSSAANVYISSSANLLRSTSSSKYKLVIENEEEKGYDFKRLLNLNIKSWYDRTAVESYAEILNGNLDEKEIEAFTIKRHYGLIAEDVYNAGLAEFVTFNDDGEIEGIEYDRLLTLLIPIVREQQQKIEKLEQEIALMKGEV